MDTHPLVLDLPKPHLEALGRVCVWWAWQERLLANITYMLLGLSPKHGRVAVRSPRADEQVAMIQQLISLEKLTVKNVDIPKFMASLRAVEKLRDQVVHGLWLKDSQGRLMLQDLSGNWKPDPHGPKVSKRISPAGLQFQEGDMDQIANLIRETLKASEALYQEIKAQLPPSRSTPLERSPQGHHSDDRNPGTP